MIGNTIGYEAISSEALPYNIHYKRSAVFAGIWLTDFKSVRDNEFYFLLIFIQTIKRSELWYGHAFSFY